MRQKAARPWARRRGPGLAACAAGASAILMLALLLLMLDPARAAAAEPAGGGIEARPCWFTPPAGREARCGDLVVPERWSGPPSRQLRLRFVIFRAAAGPSADPVINIAGGPGEPALIDAGSIGRWWDWIARQDWMQGRDLVVYDQRGVGLSEPRMDCPELVDAAYRVFGEALSTAASDAVWAGAAAKCHARLAAAGLDLTQYNTAAMVADLQSLIAHLGYRSWILLANSFGTRVALRFAAGAARGTRAMILDSVDPPQIREFRQGAANTADAFYRLFQDCRDEKSCRTAFPDLAEDFSRVLQRAAARPLTLALEDPRLELGTARLDDAKLIEVLLGAFYDWRRLRELPATIAALAAGDTRPLRPLLRLALANYSAPGVGLGLFLSVECHDEYPFSSRAEVARAADSAPSFRGFALATLPLAACPSWPAGAATAAERAPARSDIPTLILSGALDPVTPPEWAKLAAADLSHAYVVSFRGVGHGVLAAHACASLVAGRFLADPSKPPVDDCLLAVGPPQFRRSAADEAP